MCFHYYLFTWKNFCLLLSSFLEMFFSCSLLCVLPLDVSICVLFLPRPWKCTCPLLYFTWKCICSMICSYLMKYLSVVVTTVCCCCCFFLPENMSVRWLPIPPQHLLETFVHCGKDPTLRTHGSSHGPQKSHE